MGTAKIWGAPVLQGFVEKEVYKVEADMRKIKRKYHRRRREERISRKRKWSTGRNTAEKSVELKTEKGPLIKQSGNYESTFK